MNLKCLFRGHKWRFSYNHGMPFGMNTEDALKMFNEGKTFAVYECTRCPKQSRYVDGKIVILSSSLVETP